MKENKKFKNKKFMFIFICLIINIMTLSTVFANDIDVYCQGDISDGSVTFRIYSTAHSTKIAQAVRATGTTEIAGKKDSTYYSIGSGTAMPALGDCLNTGYISSPIPSDNIFHKTVNFMFHDKKKAVYNKASSDTTLYSYATYNGTVTKDKSIFDPIDYQSHTCKRPQSSGATQNVNVTYTLENTSSVKKIEPTKMTILKSKPSVAQEPGLHNTLVNMACSNNSADFIKDKTIDIRDFYVAASEYRISKAAYEQIEKDVGEYAQTSSADETKQIYFSGTRVTRGGWLPYTYDKRDDLDKYIIGGTVGTDTASRKSTTATIYYNNIFPYNGKMTYDVRMYGWSQNEKGVKQSDASVITPLSSGINAYDNIFHYTPKKDEKIVIRYIDIGKDDDLEIDRTVRDTSTDIERPSGDPFTTPLIDRLVIEEKQIDKEGDGIDLDVPDDYEYIGYNSSTEEPDYDKPKITIGHRKEDYYKIPDVEDKIYIDVFVNSKKRVYVRHLNVDSSYDKTTNKITNISYDKLNQPSVLIRKEEPTAKKYDKNGNYVGLITPSYTDSKYSECYIIKWNERIEIDTLRKADGYEFLKHYQVNAYSSKVAKSNFQRIYNAGTITVSPSDKNVRIFAPLLSLPITDTNNTYIDTLNALDDPYEEPPEDVVEEPAGKTITTDGKLMFKSTDSKFSTITADEFDVERMRMDKIPSSEEIRYGVLNLQPYILTRAMPKREYGYVYVNNGRDRFRVEYTYRNPAYVGFYGLSDTVKTYENSNLENGELLYGNTPTTLRIPLNDSLKNKIASATLKEGGVTGVPTSESRSCSVCGGLYCKDHYVKIVLKNMELKYGSEVLIDSHQVESANYKIRSTYCKKVNNVVSLDETKTQYFMYDNAQLETPDYNSKLASEVSIAQNSSRIREYSELYKPTNVLTIDKKKYNGVRVPEAQYSYNYIPNASKGGQVDTIDSASGRKLKEAATEVEEIAIHTPVISNSELESNSDFVNHTGEEVSASEIIQKNVPFKITPKTTGIAHESYPQIQDYAKYTKANYFKFSFDVEHIKHYKIGTDQFVKETGRLGLGEWVKVDVGNYIIVQALYDANDASEGDALTAGQNKYTQKTIAINAPDTNDYMDAIKASDYYGNPKQNSTTAGHGLFHGLDLDNEYKYMAYKVKESETLGRIYDFRVTDVVDIDWKNIFRKADAMSHTGRFYYAGTYKWELLSGQSNELTERPESEVGVSPKRTLPIGSFKHTNSGFSKAPKLGYKFTFDIKTTGALTDNMQKQVEIKPEFYYISNDGTKYEDDIFLYYKNSSGKYVKVGSSADKYKVTMRPADGLRHLAEYDKLYNKTSLATDIIPIGDLNEIILKQTTNMATNDNAFQQIWYGEFKLPNTTIAVKASEDNISKPLKNGYIGIKFDISCTEKEDGATKRTLKYGINDLSADGPNTSQWDYERYLGVNPGTSFGGQLKLEKGTWNINNSVYQDIKGTVLMYDTDRRASDEFSTGSVN